MTRLCCVCEWKRRGFSLTASPLGEQRGDEVKPSRRSASAQTRKPAPLSAPPPPAASLRQPMTASPLAGRSIGARHLITAARWPLTKAWLLRAKGQLGQTPACGPRDGRHPQGSPGVAWQMPALPDSDVIHATGSRKSVGSGSAARGWEVMQPVCMRAGSVSHKGVITMSGCPDGSVNHLCDPDGCRRSFNNCAQGSRQGFSDSCSFRLSGIQAAILYRKELFIAFFAAMPI